MPKEIVREKCLSPQGINNSINDQYLKRLKLCDRCHQYPKLRSVNSAQKTDVARMFDYELRCDCDRVITGTSIQDLINAWNTRYGIKISTKEETFVSSIDVDEYFN